MTLMNKDGFMVKCYEILDSVTRKTVNYYADFEDAKEEALKIGGEVWFGFYRIKE